MLESLKKYIEPRLLKYLVLFYTFIALVDFSRSFYFLYQGPRKVTDDLPGLMLVNAIDWLFVLLFMSSVATLTKYFLIRNMSWRTIIPIHVVLSAIQSYLTGFISPLLLDYDLINSDYNFFEKVTHTFFFNVTTNILLYCAMLLIVYSYFYLRQIRSQELEKKVLENSLIKLKLKTLENQLNPHFLFNTLNSISSLIKREPDTAQDMIADVSYLLRKFLEIDSQNLISIQEELEILEHYVNILKQRFQEDLIITQRVAKSTHHIKIPRLLIQSIIENSIKHGFSPKNKKLLIDLTIEEKENTLVISVENNGKKLPKYPIYSDSGIGIINMKERLQALYQDRYKFDITNSNHGVRTEIYIELA